MISTKSAQHLHSNDIPLIDDFAICYVNIVCSQDPTDSLSELDSHLLGPHVCVSLNSIFLIYTYIYIYMLSQTDTAISFTYN